jgi:hypothetical protein
MKIAFKVTASLLQQVRADLARPHPFAAERVGFLACKVAALKSNGVIVLASSFHAVEDDDYQDDQRVGAMMGPAAIRKALQLAYNEPLAMFHVHSHDHYGRPWFSRTDLSETTKFVPDFWHVQPKFPHGAIVLSLDSMAGLCWVPGQRKPTCIVEFTVVGAPMKFIRGDS